MSVLSRLVGVVAGSDQPAWRLSRSQRSGPFFLAELCAKNPAATALAESEIVLGPLTRLQESLAEARSEYLRAHERQVDAYRDARNKLTIMVSQATAARLRLERLQAAVEESLANLENPAHLLPRVREAETALQDSERAVGWQRTIAARSLASLTAGLEDAVRRRLTELRTEAHAVVTEAERRLVDSLAPAAVDYFAARSTVGILENQQADSFVGLTDDDL